MPPKPKFTKDQMIAAALDIVSEKGLSALTARNLGARLGGSSRPIFTLYHSMDEVIEQTRLLAIKRFNAFVTEDTGEEMPMFKTDRYAHRPVLEAGAEALSAALHAGDRERHRDRRAVPRARG